MNKVQKRKTLDSRVRGNDEKRKYAGMTTGSYYDSG